MSTKHIFEIASKVTKPLLANQEEYFISLLENWFQVTPKEWHEDIFPVKFKWVDNQKAILILKSKNNSSIISLAFQTNGVINKINTFFGHNVIVKILFTKK